MKKTIKLFGTTTLAVVMVFMFAALSLTGCDNGTTPTHTHQYGAWTVTTPATCTAGGVETGTCPDDGATTTRTTAIDPNGHAFTNPAITPATCEADGKEEGTCNLCNQTTTKTLAALDHNYQYVTTPATCTTAGSENGTCTRNSSHTTTQTIAALGHTAVTETGLCVRFSVCGTLTYNLGDTGPSGGKIFYRLEAGFTQYADAADTVGTTAHYLEAAPVDMSTTLMWASSAYQSTNISGTGAAIGTGRKNTALILATDVNAPAAKACNDYSNGGKTDWFLPSKDELNQLYVNRTSVGNMGTNSYLSSSQNNIVNTSLQLFSDGNQIGYSKANTATVRAVRAF